MIDFLVLIPFGILSHYPDVDSSHGLREDVKRIMDKVFSEKVVD